MAIPVLKVAGSTVFPCDPKESGIRWYQAGPVSDTLALRSSMENTAEFKHTGLQISLSITQKEALQHATYKEKNIFASIKAY